MCAIPDCLETLHVEVLYKSTTFIFYLLPVIVHISSDVVYGGAPPNHNPKSYPYPNPNVEWVQITTKI